MCIFCDIKDMGKRRALCHVHKKECEVPDVNVLLVSTSCKDLSNLSTNSRGSGSDVPVLALEHSLGGSADTFRGGLLPYLGNHEDDLAIYENSDHLANELGAASSQEQGNLGIFSG